MTSNIHLGPSQALVTQKISRLAKRLAYVQIILIASIAIAIGVLKDVLMELLSIPPEILEDPVASQEYMTQIIQNHSGVMSWLLILPIFILVTGIMYLIYFWKLSGSFKELAQTDVLINNSALRVSQSIRAAILIQFLSIIISLIITIPYFAEILNIVGFGAFVFAYYNIAQMFKILRQNDKYPKKESRVLLFSQIFPVLAMIPLTITINELNSGQDITLVTLIIGAVIIIGGYIGIAVGFYLLSSDIKSITGTQHTPIYSEQIEEHPYQPTSSTAEKEPGESIADALFCPNCGIKLKEKKSFCHKCGTNVNDY